jgi:hypothetical protein
VGLHTSNDDDDDEFMGCGKNAVHTLWGAMPDTYDALFAASAKQGLTEIVELLCGDAGNLLWYPGKKADHHHMVLNECCGALHYLFVSVACQT